MNGNVLAKVALAASMAVSCARAATALAATGAERARAAANIVEQTLREEESGAAVDRRELLKPALEQAPRHEAALWHSGFVFDTKHKQWRAFEDVPPISGEDRQLAKYRDARQDYPDTIDGQLALAAWCFKEKLPDQARAHLSKVLELNPDHVQARRMLGFQYVNGNWVEQRELAAAAARARASRDSLVRWRDELEDILRGLKSRSRRSREAAHEKLTAIEDPDAVSAIEQMFCSQGGDLALLGIQKLGKMKAYQAAEALAWQAVFSPSEPIRTAAATALRAHRKHDYVPLLLSAMDSPVKSRAQIYESLDGRLLYRHVLYREDQDKRELAVIDTPYQHQTNFTRQTTRVATPEVPVELQTETAEKNQQARLQAQLDRERVMVAFYRDAQWKAYEREMTLANRNRAVESLNQRLMSALSAATGEYRYRSPDEWWRWWNDYNELYVPPGKRDKQYYELAKGSTVQSDYSQVRLIPTPLPGRCECLAGETMVWTERGPMAIQQVQVGDRVFSCEVATGRLGLKPVLKTTIRPETLLVAIQTDGETIEATGGHVFWVAGTGWVKARDLQPGMRLHTITGTGCVTSVQNSSRHNPRNLVVADFHTYFAGEGKILTHDTTMHRPTNATVPGLAPAGS